SSPESTPSDTGALSIPAPPFRLFAQLRALSLRNPMVMPRHSKLITRSRSATPRIGRSKSFPGFRIDPNCFHFADPITPGDNFISGAFETLSQRRFSARIRLQQHHVRQPLLMKTRRVDGGLRVHSKTHPIQNRKQ